MLGDNVRVLVDWDGDGKLNSGVPSGTPDNLIPRPFFMQTANVFGTTITGHEEPSNVPEVVKDVNFDLGFQYSKIPCGGANSKRVWAGMRPTHYAQPLPSDILATFGCTLNRLDYPRGVNLPYSQEKTKYGEYTHTPTLLTGWNLNVRQVLGYNTYRSGSSSSYTEPATMTNFPVTAGQTYRVTFWHRLASQVTLTNSYAIRCQVGWVNSSGVYTNTSTLSDINVSPSSTWTQVTFTFTAPIGQNHCVVGLSVIGVVTTGTNALDDFEYHFTGLSVYPSASNPTYVADPAVVYDDRQFATLLAANTAYNYSFYAKADTFDKLGVVVQGVDAGTVTWTQLLSEQQSALTSSWQRYSVSFTTGANPQYAMLQITPYVGVNPASAGVSGNMYVRAFQLTKGATLYPLHAAKISNYEDITQYCKDLSWKFGKTTLENVLPYEGTMDITIDNDSQIFSPANTASPLYGYLKQNRAIYLQLKRPADGTWATLWAGWVESFELAAGRSLNRDGKLHCQQGVFRWREGKFTVPVARFKAFADIIKDVVASGSWRPVGSAFEGVLNFNNRLGENSYLGDINAEFTVLDEGINTYDLQGMDWGRNTTTDEALSDILSAENATLWIDRIGNLNVRNRNFWVSRSYDPDVTLSLNTRAQEATYVYGDNIVNQYEVEYQPASFNTNQVVWQTKRPEVLGGNKVKVLSIVFSLPEGRIKTVQNIQTAVTLTVYDKDPIKFPSNPAVVDSAILSKIAATVYNNGSRYYLSLSNTNTATYYISASINGDALNTGDKLAGSYSDRDSMIDTLSIQKGSFSSPVISSTEQAEAISQFFVSRNSTPQGRFSRIGITSDFSTSDYDLIMSLKIGAVVKMSEQQTVETNLLGAVVEEIGNINVNGALYYKVTLDKLDHKSYFRFDVGSVEKSNAAALAYPVGVRGAFALDKYDNSQIPVKELSAGKRDGWVYIIDRPSTVRNWQLGGDTLSGNYYAGSADYYNYGRIGMSAIDCYLGADTYVPLPVAGLNGSGTDANGNRIYGAYITGQPNILVNPFEYYKAYLTTGLASLSHDNGSGYNVSRKWIMRPFGDRYANAQGTNVNAWYGAGLMGFGLLSWWAVVSGVRTIEGNNNAANDYQGLSEDFTATEQRIYVQGLSNEIVSPRDRTVDRIRRIGFYLQTDVAYDLSLVSWSKLENVSIDSTKTYKAAMWLRTAPLSADVSWTLEALDTDHNVITSTTITPNHYAISKVELSITTGYSWVTLRLRRTSANTEYSDDRVWLYGTAVTENSLTNYTDIPVATSLVYI